MSASSTENLYIIRPRAGAQAPPDSLAARLAGRAGVVVLDHNEDGAVLASLTPEARSRLGDDFPDLLIEPELHFAPCDR